jgi:hypothetical protein
VREHPSVRLNSGIISESAEKEKGNIQLRVFKMDQFATYRQPPVYIQQVTFGILPERSELPFVTYLDDDLQQEKPIKMSKTKKISKYLFIKYNLMLI